MAKNSTVQEWRNLTKRAYRNLLKGKVWRQKEGRRKSNAATLCLASRGGPGAFAGLTENHYVEKSLGGLALKSAFLNLEEGSYLR